MLSYNFWYMMIYWSYHASYIGNLPLKLFQCKITLNMIVGTSPAGRSLNSYGCVRMPMIPLVWCQASDQLCSWRTTSNGFGMGILMYGRGVVLWWIVCPIYARYYVIPQIVHNKYCVWSHCYDNSYGNIQA